MPKLTSEQIDRQLLLLPTWRSEGGLIVRDYVFGDFAEAMKFVNQVAVQAEAHRHHPDIDIRYNKVRLSLVSHDLGGVTERDLDLAAALSQIG